MKEYETQLMIQKAGTKPARIGFLYVLANSEQEALTLPRQKASRPTRIPAS